MDKKGVLLCAKYASSPNLFGFCGPAESNSLIEHLRERVVDKELSYILSEFETLYPYLRLISYENKIEAPFDKRVVEAYWVGNCLLENIPNKDYFYFLTEELKLERKLNKSTFQEIKGKVLSYPLLPHHSFHVFNIFKRTGKDPSFHTLQTMDECRIGWGKAVEVQSRLLLETKALAMRDGKLVLDKPKLREIKIDYKGKRHFDDVKVGDWVSFHWGFACDVLDTSQVKNLEYYTQKSINFFNSPYL